MVFSRVEAPPSRRDASKSKKVYATVWYASFSLVGQAEAPRTYLNTGIKQETAVVIFDTGETSPRNKEERDGSHRLGHCGKFYMALWLFETRPGTERESRIGVSLAGTVVLEFKYLGFLRRIVVFPRA